MREIGSEFWDVQPIGKDNNMFPECTQWFLSGRGALRAILREIRWCDSVAMPSWCCDSMVKPFVVAGMDIHFYPVYWKNGVVQEIIKDCDILFLMDYFGYTQQLPDLNDFDGVIIRDVTHSIFSSTYNDADYYFGSLRKWCGVWTGGYAWTKDGHILAAEAFSEDSYTDLRKKAMQLKADYINEGKNDNKDYLKVFDEADSLLEKEEISLASDRDILLAKSLDNEKMKSKRRENAMILREAFFDWLLFPTMKDNDCPMFVPVIIPNGKRDELRDYLIKKEIYCPVHWPESKYHVLDEKSEFIYKNELSLVCDQRYEREDMQRIVDTINEFMEEMR